MAIRRLVSKTGANPTVEFSTLLLDGEKYKLVYNFNAIAEAEENAGCNLLGGLENLQNLTAIQLRGLLYAALGVAHPEITVTDAGRMIRLNTIAPITEALAEAYRLSMPEAKTSNPRPAGATVES